MIRSDEHAQGFLASAPDALRYNSQNTDPFETAGLILTMIPNGARVLDVGCGTGSISQLIIKNCQATVVGLEPNAERARIASERGVEMKGDLLVPDVLPGLGLFDVVLFSDVLEHMSDPFESLVLVRSLLRPEGCVIAAVPNIAHWTIRVKLLAGHFNYRSSGIMDATHLRWFTQKTFAQLFETAGYEVEEKHASAGTWMPVYNRGPLRLIPKLFRNFLVPRLTHLFPTIFGCQLIVRAKAKVPASEKNA